MLVVNSGQTLRWGNRISNADDAAIYRYDKISWAKFGFEMKISLNTALYLVSYQTVIYILGLIRLHRKKDILAFSIVAEILSVGYSLFCPVAVVISSYSLSHLLYHSPRSLPPRSVCHEFLQFFLSAILCCGILLDRSNSEFSQLVVLPHSQGRDLLSCPDKLHLTFLQQFFGFLQQHFL